MRILLLDQYSQLGGAQRCLLDLAAGFAGRGWELHAAAPEGDLLNRLRPLCRSVREIPCGPFHPSRKTATDAFRMLRQIREQSRVVEELLGSEVFDIVYVNGPRLMPAVALARGSAAVIFHAHSIVSQIAAQVVLRAGIRLSRASVIASSRFVAGPLKATAVGGMRIIANGVNSCTAPRGANRTRLVVAVLGRVAPEKGQLDFVRAARMMQRSRECRFVIAGAPMFCGETYFERVRAEAAGSAVEFIGWVEDTSRFLAEVDVLVVPSSGLDATPRVISEAFSAGVPVLAFATGGIPEMISHGKDGFLIHQHSAEALAGAIDEAVSCPERLSEIAARGRIRWRETFTVERFQCEVCETVQEVAQRRHQRNPLTTSGAIAEV